jgi:hypothetical protein
VVPEECQIPEHSQQYKKGHLIPEIGESATSFRYETQAIHVNTPTIPIKASYLSKSQSGAHRRESSTYSETDMRQYVGDDSFAGTLRVAIKAVS